jgi:transposase
MYHFFIGIDIGKNTFVAALHGESKAKTFNNNTDGFNKLCKSYGDYLSKALIILETTGGYEIELINYLQTKGYAIHRANTRKVKNFIRSYGTLAKSDAMDALGLALYGAERHAKLELYEENPHKMLLKLTQRRNDLKAMLVQEKNRLQAPDQKEFKKSFEAMIKAIKSQMEEIEKTIEKLCQTHVHFDELRKVLKTIKGIGDITAIQLIALLPELGKIGRRQIASLAGVAPYPNESGKKIGYRSTKGGRSDVKPVLFSSYVGITE